MATKTHNKIYNYIDEAIGSTPMVRLNKVPKDNGIKCEILVKCEFMNPGGSVKDRIGREMVLEAEKNGIIKLGDMIIEASSGNAGIGIAQVCASRGYDCLITMPEKMSDEKVNILKSLGANVVRTPTEARFFDPDSHIETAKKIRDENPEGRFILDQYKNVHNAGAHYNTTGPEIIEQTDGKFDYFFCGVGTGGTGTGCIKKMKECNIKAKYIGVDPYGSIIADPEDTSQLELPSYKVEGIGYDFIPQNCERDLYDDFVKIDDNESFRQARDMLKYEGLLCGGSCGSALAGCFKYIKENNLQDKENQRMVVVLPDSIRNYMTKHLKDEWMVKNNFLPADNFYNPNHPLARRTAESLQLVKIPHFDSRFTVGDALDAFKKGDKIIPLIECGNVKGVQTEEGVLSAIISKNLGILSSASKALSKDFCKVPYNTDLSIIHRLLSDKSNAAVLLEKRDNDGKYEGLYSITLNHFVGLFRDLMKHQLLNNF